MAPCFFIATVSPYGVLVGISRPIINIAKDMTGKQQNYIHMSIFPVALHLGDNLLVLLLVELRFFNWN